MDKLLRQDPEKELIPFYIPPNEQMLAIARLYLEKYEVLAEEDRKLYRAVVARFNEGRDLLLANREQ